MKSFFAIAAQRAMHRQEPSGFGGKLVLLALNAQYRLSLLALGRETISGGVNGWVNPDQLNRSGRCRLDLLPT